MRITGGQARGRLLRPPRGRRIRPTSDRVREAIFDILGHDLTGLMVIDLFAGTGALGIEAMSRGAKWAVFIDNSRETTELIKVNLQRCGFLDSATVSKRDLKKGIPWDAVLARGRADLIFIDPPYRSGVLPVVCKDLVRNMENVTPGTRLVIESVKTENPTLPEPFHRLTTRLYGDTRITMYRNEG